MARRPRWIPASPRRRGCRITTPSPSLTVTGGGITWKGTPSSSLTVNNLTLSGDCEFIQAGPGTWTLAGTIAVKSDEAMMRAANGPINLTANLSGGGNLLHVNNTVTLSGNNSVALNAGSATVMEISKTAQTNDQLRVTGTLTYGGALMVTNLAGTLVANDSFQLFDADAVTGAFTTTNLPPLNPGLAWNFDAPSGVLSVVPTVATNPVPIAWSFAGGNLTLSWPEDHTGWRLQTQTNPLVTGLGTNWFDVSGSTETNAVALPLDPNNGSVLYRVVYP